MVMNEEILWRGIIGGVLLVLVSLIFFSLGLILGNKYFIFLYILIFGVGIALILIFEGVKDLVVFRDYCRKKKKPANEG